MKNILGSFLLFLPFLIIMSTFTIILLGYYQAVLFWLFIIVMISSLVSGLALISDKNPPIKGKEKACKTCKNFKWWKGRFRK